MESIQIVEEAFSAIEKKDFSKVENLLHEEYQLSGPVPEPMGKNDLVAMLKALTTAFPDWAFNMTDLKESGDQVKGVFHVTGTQTGDLDLSFMGIPPHPASGIKAEQPDEPFVATLRDGKIYRLEVTPVEGGGVEGILRQVGASVPAQA